MEPELHCIRCGSDNAVTWRLNRLELDIVHLQQFWATTPWKTRTKADWEKCLTEATYAVAIVANKRIVGYGSVTSAGKHAHFHDIAVDPEYRRRKLGSQIMRELIDVVKYGNYASLTLERCTKTPGNLQFYRSLGFVSKGNSTCMHLREFEHPE